MEDKRRCHRLNIELPATFKASKTDKSFTLGTTLDISGLGFSITSKEKITVGQELPIQLRLTGGEKITVKTKVVWVKEAQVYATKEYTAGLQIVDDIQSDEKKFLKYFAEKLHAFFEKK